MRLCLESFAARARPPLRPASDTLIALLISLDAKRSANIRQFQSCTTQGDDVKRVSMNVQSSPPARANQTQKQLVKLLYVQHGSHKIASELSGVPYDTVRQWAVRGKWTKQDVSQNVTTQVQRLTERISDELAENERETRLSLSRYARRAAESAETATLRDAPYVKAAAQVAGITHKWGDQEGKASHFTLNVLNLNSLEVRPEAAEDNTPA
jgi:hypothetical protein